MSAVKLSLLEDGDIPAWDAFVRAAPDATFFHLSGWRRVIEGTFGHRTFFLQAKRDGVVVGVLPLTHVKSVLFGNSLISNAFCVYGGIVAADAEVSAALEAEAIRLAAREKVDCLEFRTMKPAHPIGSRSAISILPSGVPSMPKSMPI
jgi:CelD/BcsL family acetyltransferase involved in cellulose biosynthesis